jgi:acyl carrier protein phosphodiesterase
VNWLAHLYLSEPAIEFRLGNLLADLVTAEETAGLGEDFCRGVRRHRAIDAFTDAHPVVRQSRARLNGAHRRFAGILVDVFYDHLLAAGWDRHSDELLESFTAGFHTEARASSLALPPLAARVLQRMIAEDRLASYAGIEGVYAALQRLSEHLSERLGRPCVLAEGMPQLLAHREALAADFHQFFPELKSHVAGLPQSEAGT